MRNTIAVTFLVLLSLFTSCTDDQYAVPTLVNFPTTGLLGQQLMIEVQNVQPGRLQVFFDSEEAEVLYVSNDEIMVLIPRTITRNNPTLKVIDLNENKTILNTTFSLKTPVITSYNTDNVTFNETFIIYGVNFDILEDFVSVTVNDKNATIVNVAYDQIEVQIPSEITASQLQVKVTAQLQEVTSTVALQLKNPVITGVQNNVAWIRSELTVDGQNFNPNFEFGEVYINGTRCYYSSTNNQLSVTIPPGPYQDFKITNVTYKTGGLTYSYDCDIPIQNDAIMVDHIDNSRLDHTIFEHNGKAYQFVSESNILNPTAPKIYSLLEFSPITEKWTKLTSYNYTGFLADAVYDGSDTVYLYKYLSGSNSYTLTKLNMNTFNEVGIPLPSSDRIYGPILFAYQDNLYLLSGLNNTNGVVTVRDQKYKYSSSSNSWSQLSDTAFSDLAPVSAYGSGKCSYMFAGNNIYISYGLNNRTYKISSNLSVTDYQHIFSFEHANAIIGKQLNNTQYFFNIVTQASIPVIQDNLFDYGNSFFTLNNEIYYIKNSWTVYYQNTFYTQKLRKQIINGLL
ncbi:IPT/TIG domain-containing protein [Flavobacterium sp. GT3R68]|uniref:IPT/TIG domain-containing protein n=1 Tax=Flavobacterium sp. GT3R68 TaxID=2594437 RepID=UPI0013151B6D|nr:IPT/TIG domain-containing protein [Flavobacterium sp. GT3R68]